MRRLACLLLGVLALTAVPAGAQSPPASSINVSSTPGDSSVPTIAGVADGTQHVAWQEDDGQIYVALGDGGWASGALIEGESPALAVGPDGIPHLAYVADDGTGNLEIYHSRWVAGDWSPPVNISLTSGASAGPDVAVDADGTPHFLWADATPGVPTLYHGTPDEAGPVFNANGTAPAIAIRGSDQIHLVWQESDRDTGLGEAYHMVMRLTDGQTTSFAENLSNSPDTDSRTPDIAIASDGTVHVVWAEGGVAVVRSGQPASFSPAITVSGEASGVAGPRITSDAASNVFVAWAEGDARVRVAVRWAGTPAWQAPQTVADGLVGLETVAVDTGSAGQVHLAWSAYPPGSTAGDVFVTTVVFAPPAMHKLYLPLIARQ